MPIYLIADNANLRIQASLDNKPAPLTSATVSVWDSDDIKRVTDAVATIDNDKVTYQVATAVLNMAGTYEYEFTVVFSDSQGTLSIQGTFEVVARF